MPYVPYQKEEGQYVPYSAKQIVPQRRSAYLLEPEPKPVNIALETIKGLPEATVKVATGIGSFLKGVQEEIMRSGASVALTTIAGGVEKLGPKIAGISPEDAKVEADKIRTIESNDPLHQLIFGDRPLKSIEGRIAEGELTIKDFVKELQEGRINIPGLEPKFTKEVGKFISEKREFPVIGKQDLSLPISLIAIPGMIALDFTGGGGAKSVAKQIAKSTDIGVISKLLRQAGVAEDLVLPTAGRLVKETDEKLVLKALNNIDAIQRTTKVAKEAITPLKTGEYVPFTPKVSKGAEPVISPELKPLFQKVRENITSISETFDKSPGGKAYLRDAKNALDKQFTYIQKSGQVLRDSGNIEGAKNVESLLQEIDTAKRNLGVSKILPDLPPLAQEARKYKSAEEFAKNVGAIRDNYDWSYLDEMKATKAAGGSYSHSDFANLSKLEKTSRGKESRTFYRAGKVALDENGNMWLTPQEAGASQYGDASGISYKEYKVATQKPLVLQDVKALEGVLGKKLNSESNFTNSPTLKQAVIDYAKKNGYDSVLMPDSFPDGGAGMESLVVWDKNLVKTKSQLTDFYERAVGGKLPKAPTAQKIIGETPQAKITRTAQERVLLREKLAQQAKAAKLGAKEGRSIGRAEIAVKKDAIITILKNTTQSTERAKKLIVEHVKDALDPADRGKALTLLRDAKTHKDITKAFSRINRWAEDTIKKDIKNEILKTQKQIMDSPSIAVDYKARIKELMGDFELKGHRESTLERLKKTQEFLQSEAAKGNDVEMPRRVLKSLELLNRTPFDEITINQLTGLKAEMELLEGLGETKFRTIESLWEIQKGKILSEVSAQGAKPVQNIELIKPEIGERLTITQKFKNFIWSTSNQAARIDRAISPMDTIFDLLDGGKATYNGANFRFFKGQVDAGYGRYITRKDALQNPIIDLATKHGLDDTNFERMGVVAAREQDGGIEKLIASGFSAEQINAVKLAQGEQEVLDLMRSTFDSQFPEIKEVMRKVYNQPVEKVKNYFSFMTDWKAMDESEVFQRFGSQTPEQFGTPRKNVEAGFAKSRVGGDQKIKINALDVFLRHTDNTSYLLELGETSKMLGEVANSPKYAELVGDVGQLMVREWIDVVARKGGAAGAQEIAILNTLRKNVGIGILGLKLSTIAIQPTALIDGMGFIGAKYGMKGVTNFATNAEWRMFIGKMPEISDRMGGEFALRELTDDNWLQGIQRKGFIPMQILDQMTAGSIAAGAYERKMIELGKAIDFTKYDPEALAYAQLAVRRTQSSGAFKDVPLAVSRGALTGNRSLDRAILQFQNFLLSRWSRIRHDAIRAGINTKDPKKAVPIFTAIIMSAIAASGIRLSVNKVQDFITGREDEDSIDQDLARGFMYEMTGNVPFLGTAVSMAMYDGEMFPLLDAPKGVISGLNRVITSESEGAKLRGFTEFAGSTGAILGIPGSAQTEQLLRGVLQDEKKEKGTGGKIPAGLPGLPMLKLPELPALPKL